MSYPTQEQVDQLPKNEKGEPDLAKLPEETVRNVLLNCLATYPTKDKRDILYVQTIANAILGSDEAVELKDKLNKFLVEVVYNQTFQQDKDGKTRGIYMSWATSQVLEELGVNISED